MGFTKFYFFGIDLGHKRGGTHHSKKSLYYSGDDQDKSLYGINDQESIKVKGNFGGTFICNSFFHQSNQNLSHQIRGNADLTCFNLCDGALIEGSIPLHVEDLGEFFPEGQLIDKQEFLENLYRHSAFHDDDGELKRRLTNDLDYQLFDDVCHKLIELNREKVNTFKEATTLLINNTTLIRTFPQHIHDLINGSIMQIQVVLTQLLYHPTDVDEGIIAFKKGLVIYCEFLSLAAKYYREQAENPHYINDSSWHLRLRKNNN